MKQFTSFYREVASDCQKSALGHIGLQAFPRVPNGPGLKTLGPGPQYLEKHCCTRSLQVMSALVSCRQAHLLLERIDASRIGLGDLHPGPFPLLDQFAGLRQIPKTCHLIVCRSDARRMLTPVFVLPSSSKRYRSSSNSIGSLIRTECINTLRNLPVDLTCFRIALG